MFHVVDVHLNAVLEDAGVSGGRLMVKIHSKGEFEKVLTYLPMTPWTRAMT